MKTENLIIGFGKAGKTLAAELGKAGQKTVLVEKSDKMYGGTCINIACIPTKFLREQASKGVSLKEAVASKNSFVSKLRDKNFEKIAKTKNVKVINATASFIDEHTVEIEDSKGKKSKIAAEKIFINAGTVPNIPPIEGVDLPGVHDSTSIMEIKSLPKNLLIIGGGFIGLEFATIFADFGTEVTVLDASEKFLEREDNDVAETMKEILTKQNIKILQKAEVKKIEKTAKTLSVKFSQNGKNSTLKTDTILVATGRKPNLKNLKTKNAGIKLTEKGFVKVNTKLQTNKKHIWALGDINGGPQFTYISLDDFRIVKNQILGGDYTSTQKRKNFATAVFTNPPMAHIGKKEKDLEQAENYIISKIQASGIPKAGILGQTDGFLKAIINKKTKKIEGCTLFCAESHEMINTVKTVMDTGLPYTTLKNQVFTHPSMSEALNDLFNAE